MKTIKYIAGIILLLIVLTAIGGFVFLKLENTKVKSSYLEKEKRFNEQIVQYEKMFEADQELLAKITIFQQPKGNRDAGTYLNPALHWIVNEQLIDPTNKMLTLPQEIVNQLPYAEVDWLNEKKIDTSKIDFSWFKKLNDFDYWDLETQSPLGDAITKDPTFNFIKTHPSMTQANYYLWTKLRLMDAIKKNKMQEGINDIQNLARLLYSTEDLVHAMTAIKVLDLSREAMGKAVASKKNVKGITPITEAEIVSMRRAIYALPAFTSVMTKSEHKKKVPTFNVGKCIAIEQSGMDYYLLYEPIMSQVFASHYSDMDQLLQQTPDCRLKRFRNIWQNKNYISKNMGCEDVFATAQLGAVDNTKATKCSKMNVFYVAKIPVAASMISYTLASIASPNWWEKYRQK